MDKFVISGGQPLHGEIPASGSKNSALPALAAALLTDDPSPLHRIPRVRDIRTMSACWSISARASRSKAIPSACTRPDHRLARKRPMSWSRPCALPAWCSAPWSPAPAARASPCPADAPSARAPSISTSVGLEQLGARIQQAHGYIEAEAPEGLRGATVHFDRITVTGTEDLMMAAVLARGETVLRNAAREPEVADLAALLVKMGAQIEGAGTSTIRIQGVEKLHGADHTIIPDRIEAGTFLVAGAITGGDLTVTGCVPEHLGALVAKLQQAGAEVTQPGPTALRVRSTGRLRSVDMTTEEYPGFATDLQAQYMALMTQAEGIALIVETIFENRFMHAQELARMGANIRVEGRQAIVAGPRDAHRRRRHCLRSPRQRLPGSGRSGRQRRNRHRPRLPHRSRLRGHRIQARPRRRPHPPHRVTHASLTVNSCYLW